MQKANLFIWLIALLTLPVINSAQSNDFSLNLYSSSKQWRIEQTSGFQLNPFHTWNMQVSSRNLEDRRIDFDQTSRNSFLQMSLLNQNRLLSHELLSGYEFLQDHSSLESELNPYQNKTGFLGYGIAISPLDSLSLKAMVKGFYRQEEDRYLPHHKLISKGTFQSAGAGYMRGDADKSLQFNASAENKQMNWEKYRQLAAGITGNLFTEAISLTCAVNAGVRADDLYVLNAPESPLLNSRYEQYDRQYRTNFNANLNLDVPLGKTLRCQIGESYSLINYRHDINRSRDNGDYNNLAQMNLTYELTDNIILKSVSSYNYYIKDLSYINNTRIIDVRNTGLGLNWEYNPYDSLQAEYTVELRRTEYPDSDHKLDNDYLTNAWRVGWIVFWKDRMRIANRVLYQVKDEVFLDSWLSANNNTLTSLQWQPECDILLGDSFQLHQEYQIRADYDDYFYNEFSGIRDTFYRKIEAGYRLTYDSSPLAAKTDIPKWSLLPYRNRSLSALRIDVGYNWERNETSAKEGDIYYINGRYDRQTISLLLQKQYGILIGQLNPKYSWGNWKEYSLLMSCAWRLNRNSTLELSLNPVGADTDALDWRASCSLNLIF